MKAQKMMFIMSIIILQCIHSFSQNLPLNITYFNLPEIIKNFKLSSVTIENMGPKQNINNVNPTFLGSGFMVNDKFNRKYVITNFHVVRAVRNDENILVGCNSKDGKLWIRAQVIMENPQKDISILSLIEIIPSKGNNNIALSDSIVVEQSSLGLSLFGNNSDIQEGVGVLVIGYPLGIGGEIVSNQPLSRIGIVSQTVNNEGRFIIDKIVNPGNSGSPVINVQSVVSG